MKVIIFGLGSIGRRCARLLQDNRQLQLYAFRTKKGDHPEDEQPTIKEFSSWQEVDQIKPEVAFIANPTFLHIDTAIDCASRGMNLFIEKPLGDTTERIDQLLELVKDNGLAAYVAYGLRFHPVVEKLKSYVKNNQALHTSIVATSYLPDWRKTGNHLKSYSAYKNMGGGVILDLSHELDYLHFLSGGIRRLRGQFGRRGDVTVDAEDYADILAETDSGPANVHINFCSHLNQRLVRIDFKHISVVGDIINNTVYEYRDNKIAKEYSFKATRDDVYRKQLDYFFDNMGNAQMMNNIFEAADLFKLICGFKEAENSQIMTSAEANK